MATLQGQEIKDTYQALLKTDGNTNIDGTLQTITDGQGNATALSLSTDTTFVDGTLSNNISLTNTNFYLNDGGTSGSQYFLYNSANQSIYLNAWVGDYVSNITSSLADVYTPGLQISFVHTTLGLLTGVVSSSYFYDGEGDPLTIITLTTDPSNGVSDTYGSTYYPPNVYFNELTYSLVSGVNNTASFYTHAEGYNTTALGFLSHTEGYNTITLGGYSHAEGLQTTTKGIFSHAEGNVTAALKDYSHTEGQYNTAVGVASHAEGSFSLAFGNASHAEGGSTTSVGPTSHSEGEATIAEGQASHAEGVFTTSIGQYSHAEGGFTIASGSATYSGGLLGIPQHAEGRYNVPDTTSLLIVGNGTADNARKNAFAVTTWGTNNVSSSLVTPFISQSLNYANDTAAASGGVPLGGFYHNSGALRIRLV